MSTNTSSRISLYMTASLVFAPLIALSVMGGYLAREELRQQTLHSLETFASAQKARVEQLINNYHTIHDGIASRTQFRAHLEDFNATGSVSAADGMNKILSDARAPFSEIKGVVLLGANVAIAAEQQDVKIPATLYQNVYEKGSKSFFVQAVDVEGVKVILHAGPIKRGDNTIGVLVIAFSTEGLRSITHSADGLGNSGETVVGYFNDKKDEAILLPTRLQTSEKPITISKDSNLPIIPTLLNKQDSIFKAATDYRGKDVIAATRYLESADWAVVTKKDQSEVFANLSTFITIYIFIAAVIFGVTLLGIVLKAS